MKLPWDVLENKILKYKVGSRTHDYYSVDGAVRDMNKTMNKTLNTKQKLVCIVFSNNRNQWRLLYNFVDSEYPNEIYNVYADGKPAPVIVKG